MSGGELRSRLDLIRQAPTVVRLTIYSKDYPSLHGSALSELFEYDRATGTLRSLGPQTEIYESHMIVSISVWSGGHSLGVMSDSLEDSKINYFHLHPNETVFRFHSAITPVFD